MCLVALDKHSLNNLLHSTLHTEDSDRLGTANSIYSGIVGGLGKGLVNLGGTVSDLYTLATTSGREQAEILQRKQKDREEAIDRISNWQGGEYAVDNEFNKQVYANAEQIKADTYNRLVAETGDIQYAKEVSNNKANEFYDSTQHITTALLLEGLGEQAPQIALALVSGGTGAAIGKAVALGVSKKVAEKAVQKATQKVIQKQAEKQVAKAVLTNAEKIGAVAGSTGAIGLEAGLQDGVSAASDAHIGVYNYYDALSPDERKKAIHNSPIAQEVLRDNPNATEEELISAIADSASTSAGVSSGLYTGVSAGLSGTLLNAALSSRFVGGLGKEGSLLSKAKTKIAAPLGEGVSEYGEEYVNQVTPKYAVNRATGSEVYNDPTLYAHTNAKNAAAVALASGSGGVATSVATSPITLVNSLLKNSDNKRQQAKQQKQVDKDITELDNTKVFDAEGNLTTIANVLGLQDDASKRDFVTGIHLSLIHI